MATEFLPGWYIDPSDSTRVRYWNGAWTKDTWTLADVEHWVSRGPAPPVSLDFDDGTSSGFDVNHSPAATAGRGRRLLYGLIGLSVLVAAGAAAVQLMWN
jgi:hypothetical protein